MDATDDAPDGGGSGWHPVRSGLTVTRAVHARAWRGDHGVLWVTGVGHETPARVGLSGGEVYGLDPGEGGPVSAHGRLRYVLRLRGGLRWQTGATLSAKYGIPRVRPDGALREHLDAQDLSEVQTREALGDSLVSVCMPPHASALSPPEQRLVQTLQNALTVDQLVLIGTNTGAWTTRQGLRLLALLDALGALWLGGEDGTAAQALRSLQLSATVPDDELRTAYHRLARLHHPDRHQDKPTPVQAEHSARFAEISAAYRHLLARNAR